jgi:hypothetical protein
MTNDVLSEQITGLTTLMTSQFKTTHERLDRIDAKVGKHDDVLTQSLVDRTLMRSNIKDLQDYNATNGEEMKKVFWAFKYPKLTLVGIALFVMLTFGTIVGIYSKYNSDMLSLKKDNVTLISTQKTIASKQDQVKLDLNTQENEIKTDLETQQVKVKTALVSSKK